MQKQNASYELTESSKMKRDSEVAQIGAHNIKFVSLFLDAEFYPSTSSLVWQSKVRHDEVSSSGELRNGGRKRTFRGKASVTYIRSKF